MTTLVALALAIGFIVLATARWGVHAYLALLPADAPAAIQPAQPPRVAHAALPVIVPLALILLGSVAALPAKPLGADGFAQALVFLGKPAMALLVGAALAMTLPRPFSKTLLSQQGWVGEAIQATALILVVTGAGGAFAGVLARSDIGATLGGWLAGAGNGSGILLPFVIAALVKTAQGSSTVAMITTAGIVLPLLPALGLDGEAGRALATVAIGAGAMVVSHANDSYFWVVTQFSGMTPRQGYALHTVGTLLQGAVAGAVVCLAAVVML